MEIASLQEFLEIACELQKPNRGMFVAIYNRTNGRPCDGCCFRNHCLQKHDLELSKVQSKKKTSFSTTETNAEIAKRIGVTPRQISKMRKAGKL